MRGKIIPFLVSAMIVISPITAYAGSFGGGHSSGSHSGISLSKSSHSNGSFSHTPSNAQTYHSGYKSPSSNVNRSQAYNSAPAPSKTRGILSHAAAFGAGALLGSMFHPFGGGGGGMGTSFFGLLMDILIIAVIFFIARKLFFKRA
ncbi:hypothetical protein PP175_03375 [Aneurinibacillus sp. Ricciae_BoGa-3]|uniref:hypothetical protein n=1 Tax=Aneurinibacillus sp. Ricciae_BoGa-3 TaxID=3022697 RepID=UPI00234001A4|nr:hypothetical protein [Aneurinibacillus sp. Ricciae_BoGa-3]WCK55047.1 hypothetical protein PP175_03375 [Aneurinibacillus sp. Ricciae_BoGa-3]